MLWECTVVELVLEEIDIRGVTSIEAEEAVASSLFANLLNNYYF